MKTLGALFGRGLLVVLPVALTVWVLWWVGALAERTLGAALRQVVPEESYVTGMGLLAGVVVLVVVGLLTRAWLVQQLIEAIEDRIERLPVIKVVYGAFRDVVAFVRDDDEAGLGRPVLLELGEVQLIGFVTRDDGKALGREDGIVVYLPLAYQIGGYTVVVPPDAVRTIEGLNTKEALRYALTAGVIGRRKDGRGEDGPPPR